jgi:two-component system, NtrC family, sensor kinase
MSAKIEERTRERQAAPSALCGSLELMQSIIDTSTAVIYLKDLEGRYQLINRRYVELFHIDKDTIVGKTDYDIFSRERADAFRDFDQRVLAAGTTLQAEEVVPQDDGPHTYISLKYPLYDVSGEAYGVCGISSDITALKLAERAIRESENRFHSLFRNMNEGTALCILVRDAAGVAVNYRIMEVNPSFERIFGVTQEDVVDKLGAAVFGTPSPPWLPEFLAGAKAPASFETYFEPLRKELFVSVAPWGEDGVAAIVSDVTERKNLQAQLLHSQKMESIGQLAAGIAHEINTPIQFVSSNLSFLMDSMRPLVQALVSCRDVANAASCQADVAEKIEEASQVISDVDVDFLTEEVPKALRESQEGVDRVASIVLSIKKFAYPDNDEKKSVDVNAAVENTVQVARNEWKYVADVDLNLAPDLPPILCAPGDLNQVILNILVNAAHAIGSNAAVSPGKGKITIATRLAEGFVEIATSDTGKGIPEAIRGRIFDPFFTTKEVGKGTGQGLSIVFSLLKKHAGTVHFTSEEGHGATFVVRFPVAPPDAIVPSDAIA